MMNQRPGIPLFYKLWFAFVAMVALLIIGGQLWLGATAVTDPERVGRYLGEVVKGFDEAR